MISGVEHPAQLRSKEEQTLSEPRNDVAGLLREYHVGFSFSIWESFPILATTEIPNAKNTVEEKVV